MAARREPIRPSLRRRDGGETMQPTSAFAVVALLVAAGASAADLYVAWWDGAVWQSLGGTIDEASGTATVQLSHLTQYALLAKVNELLAAAPQSLATPHPGGVR